MLRSKETKNPLKVFATQACFRGLWEALLFVDWRIELNIIYKEDWLNIHHCHQYNYNYQSLHSLITMSVAIRIMTSTNLSKHFISNWCHKVILSDCTWKHEWISHKEISSTFPTLIFTVFIFWFEVTCMNMTPHNHEYSIQDSWHFTFILISSMHATLCINETGDHCKSSLTLQ